MARYPLRTNRPDVERRASAGKEIFVSTTKGWSMNRDELAGCLGLLLLIYLVVSLILISLSR